MKTFLISICGESDHPLLPKFIEHYSNIFGNNMIIEFGVVGRWFKENGNTSGQNKIFPDKQAQQNAALSQVPSDVDYVFYFDIDEFLSLKDFMQLQLMLQKTNYSTISFQMNHFWKSDKWIGTGGEGWAYDAWCPRIFKFTHGSVFTSHRPPILISAFNISHSEFRIPHFFNFRIQSSAFRVC